MRVYLEKSVVVGLMTMLSVLVGLGVMSYLNNKKFAASSHWVAHTHEVLFHAEQLLASLVDAETGQRGYSITGEEIFLTPYKNSLNSVSEHLRMLETLTADNPSQQLRLKSLRGFVQLKLDLTAENVELSKSGLEKVRERMKTLEGVKAMNDIRNEIERFQQEEARLLIVREKERDRNITYFNIAFGCLIIVSVIVLAVVFRLLNTHLRARIQAESALKKAADEIQDLYDNAPCGYHSIDNNGKFVSMNNTLLSWLQYSRDEIKSNLSVADVVTARSFELFREMFPKFKADGKINNVEFEMVRKDGSVFPVIINALAIFDRQGNYVKSRTTLFDNTERRLAEDKLRQANRELESFTYTVSHDLRAPLRSINGYSQILENDFGPSHDQEGKRLLSIIAKNARQMGQLIDDLLEFSHLGKRDLHRSKISMDDIIRPIVNELTEIEKKKGRNVNVIIYLMESAWVDVKMMRQVWTNLVSNALKYTEKKENSSIQIGSYPSPPETIYYIKDNGVGFDMQYVDKLFGVFQRLHRVQDFEGTGVGLAIVKRIIERHEGKVWAESTPNAGASFYFSIPNA